MTVFFFLKLNNAIKGELLTVLSYYKGYNVDVISIAWNLIFYLVKITYLNINKVYLT